MIKNIFKNVKLVLVLVALISSFTTLSIDAHAAAPDMQNFLESIGQSADLYSPSDEGFHDSALDENVGNEGVSVLQSVVFQLLDVVKYILGSAVVLMLTILGIRLIVSSSSEEEITKAKQHFTYALIGFVLVMIADYFVFNVFYGVEGETLANTERARFFASQGSVQLQSIYSAIEYFIGAIAVLVIVINGFKMIVSAGEDLDAEKKAVQWAVAGLVLVGLSELVVKEVLFEDRGSGIDIPQAIDIIIMMTNFITGFVSFVSVALVIYGGILYLLAFFDEGNTDKAKKVLLGAVIGILVVLGSYALTATLLTFTQ